VNAGSGVVKVVAVGEMVELRTTGEVATVMSVMVCPTRHPEVTVELHAGTLESVLAQVKTMLEGVAANADVLRHSSRNSFFISSPY
jgi:hypothetical protein